MFAVSGLAFCMSGLVFWTSGLVFWMSGLVLFMSGKWARHGPDHAQKCWQGPRSGQSGCGHGNTNDESMSLA